ncbi:MAG TPA: TIGR00366 family protein [bacterium]|nr:TIGR00366 family protein [bacterium]
MTDATVPSRHPRGAPAAGSASGLARVGLALADWCERWFPDAFVFAMAAVVIVAIGALLLGASLQAVMVQFGKGFWDLITFTMQMALIIIGGYVVAVSPPIARLIESLARVPKTGRGAIAYIAGVSMLASMISWGFSLIFSGLLVRALARRQPRMDYRAAGAAAYLGLGSIWALGLSSSAALLQANPASLPPALAKITGVIPFTETIFLWQGLATALILLIVSVAIAFWSAPSEAAAHPASALGVTFQPMRQELSPRQHPSEWLEYSPMLTILIVLLGVGWLVGTFATAGPLVAISNLNTYNFIFLMAGLLLHWQPRRFLQAVTSSVPATAGVLIQFPFYAGIAAILTGAANPAGVTLSNWLAHLFVSVSTQRTFPLLASAYSAVLGLFVPSGGGKWIIEAPYIMQAANSLHVHLGWVVQIYNAAEALPNLVNPFWMLPLLGVLGVKARELVGYSLLQLIVHVPLVFFLMWLFAMTLPYHPPMGP